MAGIDKTFIKGSEYPEYREWWIKNYNRMVEEMEGAVYLYPFENFDYIENRPKKITPEFLKNNTQDLEDTIKRERVTIWNTSQKWDEWLIYNCPILSYHKNMWWAYEKKSIEIMTNPDTHFETPRKLTKSKFMNLKVGEEVYGYKEGEEGIIFKVVGECPWKGLKHIILMGIEGTMQCVNPYKLNKSKYEWYNKYDQMFFLEKESQYFRERASDLRFKMLEIIKDEEE